MSQQILDILLRIDARTAAVTAAQRSVARLEQSFSSLGRVAGTIAGVNLSLQGMVGFMRSSIGKALELGDKMGNLAQRFDTTVEAISVIDYQARRSGLSIDDLTGFADRLVSKLAEAESGSVTAAKSFGDLGLSIEQLRSLPLERKLELFGRALLSSEGDAKAYAAAVDIAGTNSQKLFATLRELSAFDRAGEAAERAGQKMGAGFTKELAEAKQRLEDLDRRWTVFVGKHVPGLIEDFLNLGNTDALLRKMEEQAQRARGRTAQEAAAASPGLIRGAPLATIQARAGTGSIREEQARIWLASEEARRMRERVQAGEQALAGDRQRLETLQIRLRVLDGERVMALQAAGSQAEREAAALQYGEKMIEVMKEIESAQKAIETSEKQAQTEREKALALEMQRRQLVLDRLQFERQQIADRQDLSEVEKQTQIKELVEAQRVVVAEMVRLKKEALAVATEAERVQLEADIQTLEQQGETLGKGVEPLEASWENQIGLADTLRGGIDGLSRSLGHAAVAGEDLGEAVGRSLQAMAADLAAATIRAVIFRAIMSAVPGLGGFLGLPQLGFAGGGYTGPGPRSRPAGVVHKGEFVFPKAAVDRVGVGYFQGLLSSMRGSAPGYASGGLVGEIVRRGGGDTAAGAEPVVIHNHFESGLTPAQFAALLPEMERRQRRGIMDAMQRRREGFGRG